MAIKQGTAGWSIARETAGAFPGHGSSLERYSARFPVAEINSSFHRPHRVSTWERWRESVPASFRFSVKLPKAITHEAQLHDCSRMLEEFLEQVGTLGDKLAVLLVQLPPKLLFNSERARKFFAELQSGSPAKLACEPRNASWFTEEADALLNESRVARVAADPAISAAAAVPGGWNELGYWRLHGSPVVYRSSYASRIPDLAKQIATFDERAADTWVIFDNTASSAAVGDALALAEALGSIDG